MAMNILKNFDLGLERNNPESVHKIVESIKLACADGRHWIT